MLEGLEDFLQRKGLISPVIRCYFPHMAICTRSDLLDDLISVENMLVDSLVIRHQTDIYNKNKNPPQTK